MKIIECRTAAEVYTALEEGNTPNIVEGNTPNIVEGEGEFTIEIKE
jgi:hypothetical protein